MKRKAVTIVGISDDGCTGLSSRALNAVAQAQWLVGGERQLAFFPDFGGERLILKGSIATVLERVKQLAEEHQVCVLASGDPLFFGVGNLLVRLLGSTHVEVLPQPTSMQWAFARVGLKWDDALLLSLHGRPRTGFLTQLKQTDKAALFTDEHNSPAKLALHMMEHGEHEWRAWVCENLCGPDEKIRSFNLAELAACADISALNLLILERTTPGWQKPPAIPYLSEDAFAKRMPKKGLITKREVRLLSLAALGIRPNSVIWDVGAGSGSVAIEAAMLAPTGRVYAIEVDPEGVAICHENVLTHSVDNVTVIAGKAPEALAGLEEPDAVFIGGSKGNMEPILTTALARLKPGGRLVVNAITLENTQEAYQTLRQLGFEPEVLLVQISRSTKLASYLRYEALNPIQIFAVEKPLLSTGAA